MDDIQKLTKAFDELSIEYVIRDLKTDHGSYQYLFIGQCRNLMYPELSFEDGDLDHLTASHRFFEFEDGDLATYSNS